MRSTLFAEACVKPATLFEEASGARIRWRLWSIDAHAEQKGMKLRRTGDSSKIHEHHCGAYGRWEKCKRIRKHKHVFTMIISS